MLNKISLPVFKNEVREVVKAIIYKDQKYLLQLRDNKSGISCPNTWSFFGGDVDNREDFVEAMKRELMEELSWFPEKLFYLVKSKDNKANCINTYYMVHCEVPEHALVLGEGQAMEWFTIDDVMKFTNIPDIVVLMLKKAHKHINSL